MAAPPPDFEAPPWLQWFRKHIWVISFVLGAVAITAVRPLIRRVPDPPPVMFQLPDGYSLVDHRGEPFTPETMKGKVWVASFVFTTCPSTCPAVTRAMKDLRDRFERNDIDVELVSFTVDPEHDTPEVLAEYARNVGADSENWRFVTGEPEAVSQLIGQGFKLGVGEPEDQGGGLYDIAHSTKLALVDERGGVRGYYGLDPEPHIDGGLAELYERADRVWMETKRGDR